MHSHMWLAWLFTHMHSHMWLAWLFGGRTMWPLRIVVTVVLLEYVSWDLTRAALYLISSSSVLCYPNGLLKNRKKKREVFLVVHCSHSSFESCRMRVVRPVSKSQKGCFGIEVKSDLYSTWAREHLQHLQFENRVQASFCVFAHAPTVHVVYTHHRYVIATCYSLF